VQLIIDAAAKAVTKLQSLPAGHKETFASGFIDLTTKLHSRTDEFLASCEAVPAGLPDPLPQPNVLFKPNRKRGYTGTEAAEEAEKDARRARRRAERDAEALRRENEARSQELLKEHTARCELATSSSDELSDPPITQVTENEARSDSNDDIIPSSHPTKASSFIQVPATAPTSTRSSARSRKHTKKFESQHTRDITAVEGKEQRRKEREAKANRTGTGRTKAAEALAQTSQLLDGIELPFRSSQ
jgi:hypothetical protein